MQIHTTSHQGQMPSGLPPSPTLTNPDMILPYTSPSPVSTTSITSRESFQYPSHTRADGNARLKDDSEQNMRKGFHQVYDNDIRPSRKEPKKTMPLGEDVNGNARNREHRPHRPSRERLFISPSPSSDDDRGSGNPGNTTNVEVRDSHWEGFDGPMEEVRGTLYNSEASNMPQMNEGQGYGVATPSNSAQGIRAILEEDEDDPQSHAAMSKRAEQILANAKKRLLTMESNLNRARYGLNRRPSSSMSSFANHSPESVSLSTLPNRQDSSGIHAFQHRQPDSPTTFGKSKGHARGFSETSVPSSLQSSSHTQEHEEASKASNPMDTDAAAVDSLGEWDLDTERNWFWSGFNRDGSNIGRMNTPLEPLHEDKPAPVSFDPSPFASSPLSQNNQHHHFAPDQISSGSSSLERESPTAAGVGRARSTDQMRDLRDQMQDLKGRISSLKQRAQEDSLRRRSLQSLRTPSPFTAAELWYTGVSGQLVSHTRAAEDQMGQEHSAQIDEGDESGNLPHDDGISSAITPASDANQEEGVLEPEDNAQLGNTYQNVLDKSDHGRKGVSQSTGHNKHEPPGTISEPHLTQELDPMDDGFHTSAEEDSLMKLPDDESDSEILNSPIGERHEDRPDAFDYEHFYLHSSMGHYGRADISRTSSHSSIYSVETTKPSNSLFAEPAEVDDISNSHTDGELYPRHNGHLRQNSGESVSTVATFATATEGREHEEEWFHRRPVASSWESDYPSKRNFNMTSYDTPSDRSEHAPEIRVATAVNRSPSTNPSPSFSPHTPTQSPPAAASSPSLSMDLLSALSSLSPTHNGTPARPIQLNDRDKELVERLIQSLSKVCTNLHIGTMEGGKYENRVWRRRLDAARRVLDGETNGEAF